MNIECPNREKNVSNEMLLKSVFISITLCMVLGLSMLNPVYLSNRIYGVTNSTKNLIYHGLSLNMQMNSSNELKAKFK